MIRLSCIRPERIIEKFDGQTINGITFQVVSTLGLQVTLSYDCKEELEEEEIEGKIKAFMKKDEIFKGIIVGIEFI